ncbi:hypothetical protein MTO96_032670, partial [Rhipicephalus appendiculatus]
MAAAARNRVFRGASPSSPPSSSDESSSTSQEGSPKYESPRPVSSRASRSYDTVNVSPVQLSPPPGWYGNPRVRSPSFSAPDVRARGTGSTHAGISSSWWLVPVMVFGACAGLILLAVAALGTTYTYRSVIARIAAAEKAASEHAADFGNRSILLTEDEGEAVGLLSGVLEYGEDRDDVADDGANGPRPRIWCFLRRLDTPPSKTTPGGHRATTARASAAPRGLCSALVYQGVRVVWRDAEASID